jgi:hypothetical protein
MEKSLKEIHKNRFKLISGIDGGIPLNMTFGYTCKVLRELVFTASSFDFSVVAMGFGDGEQLAMFLAFGAKRVGGLEVSRFGGEASYYAERMFSIVGSVVPESLKWGVDIQSIDSLLNILNDTGDRILAYSFDDSIPLKARIHWYNLIENDDRVIGVVTTYNSRLALDIYLPSFDEVIKIPVKLEGGKCQRTIIILKKKYNSGNSDRSLQLEN